MEEKRIQAGEKRPYLPPKLVRIKLDSEQAILGTCSSGAPVSTGGSSGCKAGVCRRRGDTHAIDSGATS